MKKYCFLLILVNSGVLCKAQSVGINSKGTMPDNSTDLYIKSTTKGLLIPGMLQAQRNAIAKPVNGLFIYQHRAAPGIYYVAGETWANLSSNANTNPWTASSHTGSNATTRFKSAK